MARRRVSTPSRRSTAMTPLGGRTSARCSASTAMRTTTGRGRIGVAYRSKIKYNVIGTPTSRSPTPPILTGSLAPLARRVVPGHQPGQPDAPTTTVVSLAVEMPDCALAFLLSKGQRQVGLPCRRQLDRLEQHPAAQDRAQQRCPLFCAARKFQGHVALLRGGELLLRRQDRAARGRCVRSVAGQQYRPVAAVARQRPHVAHDRGPVQVQLRRSTSTWARRTSSSRTARSTIPAIRPALPSNGLINGSYDNHVVIVSAELNYRWR